jgi:hypothetical protein
VDTSTAAATQVRTYIGELIFNALILVGFVKMSDLIIREMMGNNENLGANTLKFQVST